MRGMDDQTDHMFSYLPSESPVRPDHRCGQSAGLPMRALTEISPELERLYSDVSRPSIPPEQLLRAVVVQILYSVRSERC